MIDEHLHRTREDDRDDRIRAIAERRQLLEQTVGGLLSARQHCEDALGRLSTALEGSTQPEAPEMVSRHKKYIDEIDRIIEQLTGERTACEQEIDRIVAELDDPTDTATSWAVIEASTVTPPFPNFTETPPPLGEPPGDTALPSETPPPLPRIIVEPPEPEPLPPKECTPGMHEMANDVAEGLAERQRRFGVTVLEIVNRLMDRMGVSRPQLVLQPGELDDRRFVVAVDAGSERFTIVTEVDDMLKDYVIVPQSVPDRPDAYIYDLPEGVDMWEALPAGEKDGISEEHWRQLFERADALAQDGAYIDWGQVAYGEGGFYFLGICSAKYSGGARPRHGDARQRLLEGMGRGFNEYRRQKAVAQQEYWRKLEEATDPLTGDVNPKFKEQEPTYHGLPDYAVRALKACRPRVVDMDVAERDARIAAEAQEWGAEPAVLRQPSRKLGSYERWRAAQEERVLRAWRRDLV